MKVRSGLFRFLKQRNIENYKINIIPVQPLVIGVHPSVFEIQDNRKLRYVDGDMLELILKGKVSNWQEVGGIDLPLRLIVPPARQL